MKKLFLFALTVASLSACKKDSENTPSKTDLLTSKKWRVTSFTATYSTSGGGAPTTNTVDQYAQTPACSKDDFYKFNSDKTLILDEGATKCGTSDPQTTAFTWDLNSDQTKLFINASGSSSSSPNDIVELSASTMRLHTTDIYTANGLTITSVADVTFTAF
jgi:hypothetical protein